MKIHLTFQLFIFLFMSCSTNHLFAQFTNPSLPDQSYSAGTVSGRNTGCDSKEFNGDVYRVSVWEPTGTTQSFGWAVTLGSTLYTGTLPFSVSSVMGDPDVCLLKKPITDEIFAAVVYYDVNNGEWDLELYEWDLSSTQFVSASIFFQLATGTFGTSINIDGNDHSDSEFTIVWDDVDDAIHTTVGDMASLVLYNDLTLTSGNYPDASMFYDGTYDVVHLTFIDGNGDVQVWDYDFSDLVSGNASSPTTLLSQSPQNNGVYSYPRIACPPGSAGSVSDWTVVLEEVDMTGPTYYIVGYNDATGNTQFIYNDGNAPSPADLTGVPNYYVSVCYDNNYPNDGIWVGWQFDDVAFPYQYSSMIYANYIDIAGYSIVLKCDQDAIPLGTPDYLQVPTSITANNGDLSGFLSLAGRYGLDELFLTFQNITVNGSNVYDINYKIITGASGISALKTDETTSDNQIILPQPSREDMLEMIVYSPQGQIITKGFVMGAAVSNTLSELLHRVPDAVYLVRLIDYNQQQSYHYKIGTVK